MQGIFKLFRTHDEDNWSIIEQSICVLKGSLGPITENRFQITEHVCA